MVAISLGSIGLGLIIGLIFSLLFVSFDTAWEKSISAIFSCGGTSVGLWGIYEKFHIDDYTLAFTSIGIFCVSFLLTFIIFMFTLCKIMKDKDDTDILRIRDVFLGQQKYIQKYYESREREIDDRLNIPELEKREKAIHEREQHLEIQKEKLETEKEEFSKLTEDRLKIKLPEKKELIVSKEFLDLLPSYVEGLAAFIGNIQEKAELFLSKHTNIGLNDFREFLTSVSCQVLEDLFGRYAKDVRVHFRYYDEKKNGYKKLVSVIAGKVSNRDLTFIPYDRANMIIKSFECKRALIKSYNIEYDYVGNNNTTWTEYITVAFYNIVKDNKPCLSFGISVKNATRYKNLFNFLNYCKFEAYLQDIIEQLDERYHIETILYEDHPID